MRLQDPGDICEAQHMQAGDAASHLLDGLSSEKDTVCVASGRVVKSVQGGGLESVLRCRRCRHDMLLETVDTKRLRICSLCHARIATNA